MKQPIVICGATGNIGSRIAGILLAGGEPVRVVERERIRLGPLTARGREGSAPRGKGTRRARRRRPWRIS